MRQRDPHGVVAGEFLFRHVGEHEARAALGAVRIVARRQPRRRLHQARQQRRFGERQLPRRFGEIALRRRLDAISAGAEIDAIEIELEDLCLGEFVLEPERQHHFLQLARNGALLRQEQIFGELLGDGRAALRGAAAQDVGGKRAHDPERIDAVVRIEAPILDGDECLGHIVRQFVQRHRRAAHVAASGERRAIGAEDQNRRRTLGDFERLDGRKMDADPDDNVRSRRSSAQSASTAPQ